MLEQSEKTVTTLSNAISLVTAIVMHVSGSEVADTLNGSAVSRATMDDIVASRMARAFSGYTSQSSQQVKS